MKCPNCSKEIPENKKFCGFCGARMEGVKAEPIKKAEYLDEEKPAAEHGEQEKTTSLKTVIQDKGHSPAVCKQEGPTKDAGRKKPKKKRRLLAIILPLIFVSAIVLAVMLWIKETNRHLASLNPIPETTQQTIEVLAYCQDSLGSDVNYVEYISQDQEIILKYGWLALTEDQIRAYINGSEHVVYLDDMLISGFELGPVEAYAGPWPAGWHEEETGYNVMWKKNVGQLEPGLHYVTYTSKITSEIFDGYDTYIAGDKWTSGCEIIIE